MRIVYARLHFPRIDRYFIDRTAKVVIPVEQKVSSNLPAVIADANRKYGPLLAKMGPPVTAHRAHGGRFNLDASYKWEPRLHIFALGTWGAVPGESTATMDRLGIPVHRQDTVLKRAARRVLEQNLLIETRRWPVGGAA